MIEKTNEDSAQTETKLILSFGLPRCPSAGPDVEGSIVLGIIEGTEDEPQVAYFEEPQPVTSELRALSGPLEPTEVFRFSAPCAEHSCKHFDGNKCQLARRVSEMLLPVVDILPTCRIRPTCRWWLQVGKDACLRCPQIITEISYPTEEQRRVAGV